MAASYTTGRTSGSLASGAPIGEEESHRPWQGEVVTFPGVELVWDETKNAYVAVAKDKI